MTFVVKSIGRPLTLLGWGPNCTVPRDTAQLGARQFLSFCINSTTFVTTPPTSHTSSESQSQPPVVSPSTMTKRGSPAIGGKEPWGSQKGTPKSSLEFSKLESARATIRHATELTATFFLLWHSHLLSIPIGPHNKPERTILASPSSTL